MIIAQQKRKENLVEYLLYMWQVEDLIRAHALDIDKIQQGIIDQYGQPDEVRLKIRQWYEEIIEMMRSEGVAEAGHIQLNKNILSELTDLHLRLLKDPQETAYGAFYHQALPYIVQLRAKSGGVEIPEIETCFIALYGYLLLRMQQKEVHAETLQGIKQIHSFLNFLGQKHQEEKEKPFH